MMFDTLSFIKMGLSNAYFSRAVMSSYYNDCYIEDNRLRIAPIKIFYDYDMYPAISDCYMYKDRDKHAPKSILSEHKNLKVDLEVVSDEIDMLKSEFHKIKDFDGNYYREKRKEIVTSLELLEPQLKKNISIIYGQDEKIRFG